MASLAPSYGGTTDKLRRLDNLPQMRTKKPYTLQEIDGKQVRIYASGAVLDHGTGQIVRPAQRTLITPERAPILHRQAAEARHERAIAGANRALAGVPGYENKKPSGLDFLEAITEQQTLLALTGPEAYQTKAAQFVVGVTGQQEQQAAPAASAIAGLLGLALGLAAQRGEAGVLPATEPQADTVDADVTETE